MNIRQSLSATFNREALTGGAFMGLVFVCAAVLIVHALGGVADPAALTVAAAGGGTCGVKLINYKNSRKPQAA